MDGIAKPRKNNRSYLELIGMLGFFGSPWAEKHRRYGSLTDDVKVTKEFSKVKNGLPKATMSTYENFNFDVGSNRRGNQEGI